MSVLRDGLHTHPGRAEEVGHVVCNFLRGAFIDAGAACAARAARKFTLNRTPQARLLRLLGSIYEV